MPDEPGQADGAAVDQRDTPPPAVHAEDGVAGGDAQIAPQRELEPAGDGMTFHRRDDGLVEQHAGRAHRPVAVGRGPVAAAGRDRLEVGAGAERAAGAGEDRDIAVGVVLEGAEGVGQRLGRRTVDGVPDLGPVDGHDRDRSVVVDAYRAHAGSSFVSTVATRCAVSFSVTTDRSPERAAATRVIDV